jgi:hypothetical protein
MSWRENGPVSVSLERAARYKGESVASVLLAIGITNVIYLYVVVLSVLNIQIKSSVFCDCSVVDTSQVLWVAEQIWADSRE